MGILRVVVRAALIALSLALLQVPDLLKTGQAVASGDANFQRNDFADALIDYQAAYQTQPGDPRLLERLAESAAQAHRIDMAMLYLQQLAAVQGWTPARYRQMADLLIVQGDRQQAVIYWQAALTGHKDDIPTLRQLADYALGQRDWQTAIDRLNQLITLDPGDLAALYHLGLLLAPTDPQTARNSLRRASVDANYRDAAKALDDVFSQGGSSAQLTMLLAVEITRLQAWPEAEHALTFALRQEPGNPAALALLGLAQDEQGHDGWSALNHAAALAPDDPLVNYALAVHWRLTGDVDKAIAALNHAGGLDPTNAAIAAELGSIYRARGQLGDAAQWLNTAVALAPNDAHLQILLATFYADENYDLTGEGLTAIRKIADKLKDDPNVLASLGWALVSAQQMDAAQPVFQKALTLDPTNVRTRYYVALYHEYHGDRDGAIQNYLMVYHSSSNNNFKDLAVRALNRLDYKPFLGDLVGNPTP